MEEAMEGGLEQGKLAGSVEGEVVTGRSATAAAARAVTEAAALVMAAKTGTAELRAHRPLAARAAQVEKVVARC